MEWLEASGNTCSKRFSAGAVMFVISSSCELCTSKLRNRPKLEQPENRKTGEDLKQGKKGSKMHDNLLKGYFLLPHKPQPWNE